jgi:hypothetical protein
MTFLNNVWPNSFIKLFSLREYKILLLLLFCIIIFSSAEIISSSESKRILSIETKTYEAVEKFGEVEKVKLLCVQIEKFNEYGNLIEGVTHDSDENDGTIYVGHSVLIYNEKGGVKEINEYSSDGSLDRKSIYKYDDKDKLKEMNEYYSDGSLYNKKTYKYDVLGKLLACNNEYFSPKGNSGERMSWAFDIEMDVKYYYSKGKIKEIVYNKFKKSTFRYDSIGNLLEHKIVYINGNNEKYRYNEKGDVIFHKLHFPSHYYPPPVPDPTEAKPPKGMEEQGSTTMAFDNIHTYDYTYDNFGNWIKRIEFHDREAYQIIERSIVYN